MIQTPASPGIAALAEAVGGIDGLLDATIRSREQGPAADLYRMLRYFLGFLDERFETTSIPAGKRFRPALCLLLAQCYGVREKTRDAALAIELFHNFTLIHDDVEDHDETRRGRATVWKLWGVNHAINSGDVQSLIAADMATRAAFSGGNEDIAHALLGAFMEVGEGQYLDFELTNAALDRVTVEDYLVMAEKKSGALVGISAEIAGVVAGVGPDERASLRRFGRELGTAYQIADDYRSVWLSETETGKDLYSDIREHKRAYPFLRARAALPSRDQDRLATLFSVERQLRDEEIGEVLALFAKTDAKELTRDEIERRAQTARESARSLSVSAESREILVDIVDALCA